MYYFMNDIVSPTDMFEMNWIRFFHLYETHTKEVEKQVSKLK